MFFADVNGLELGLGSCVHVLMSGWTNVLPAPLRLGLLVRAAPAAVTAMVPSAATAARASAIRTCMPFFGIEIFLLVWTLESEANVWIAELCVGNTDVTNGCRNGYRHPPLQKAAGACRRNPLLCVRDLSDVVLVPRDDAGRKRH